MAQSNLGAMYDRGQGVKQDSAEAVRWYRRSANQGNAEAQFNLGLMYHIGRGVTQDYVQALLWLNLAASRATGDVQKTYAHLRDTVASEMDAAQISESQRLTQEWKPVRAK